jgi:transcriptional regulator with XRE-family HTH domain
MIHNGLNIKRVSAEKGVGGSELAKRINQTPQSVNSLFKTKSINDEKLALIAEALGVDISLLMEDSDLIQNGIQVHNAPQLDGDKLTDHPQVHKISGETKRLTNYKPSKFEDLVPFWDIDFIAGNNFDSVDSQTSKPTYYMDIPDFRGCTAFRAYSDSMEGLIKSGSILFGTKVERWDEHLEYGQVYGIVCDDGRKYLKYIKRYRENPHDYFLLESENKAYDEFEMPKSAIRSIWLIHGHLSKRI